MYSLYHTISYCHIKPNRTHVTLRAKAVLFTHDEVVYPTWDDNDTIV